MIHGGLRYLQKDPEVTLHSCVDSGAIQRIAPHLVFRIPFVMPVFAEDPIGPELVEVGLEMYDRYQPFKNGRSHTRLSRAEALRLEPALSPRLDCAFTLDEWGVDAARLTAANALDAAARGAHVWTHVEAVELLRDGGRVSGARVRDRLTGDEWRIEADLVMNATGPWAPKVARMAGVEVRLRPAKGIHLVFERRVSQLAIYARGIDGRDMFTFPHEQNSMAGTTDDDFYGDLDRIDVSEDEVEYVLQAMERSIPGIRAHRVIHTLQGVRPTLYGFGGYEDELSRDYLVLDHARDGAPGFFSILGGKLAAYRLMAQDASDRLCAALGVREPCRTATTPLPGGDGARRARGRRALPHAGARGAAARVPPRHARRGAAGALGPGAGGRRAAAAAGGVRLRAGARRRAAARGAARGHPHARRLRAPRAARGRRLPGRGVRGARRGAARRSARLVRRADRDGARRLRRRALARRHAGARRPAARGDGDPPPRAPRGARLPRERARRAPRAARRRAQRRAAHGSGDRAGALALARGPGPRPGRSRGGAGVRAVVVGGGLAGCAAALELAAAGAEVTLVRAGPGATALGWGTLDVAAASPLRRGGLPLRDAADGAPLAPLRRLEQAALAQGSSPSALHPYAVLWPARHPEPELKEAVAGLDAWLAPAGLRVTGDLSRTRWLADVHGALRASDFAFSGAGEGDLDDAEEVALVEVPGLAGYEARAALRTLAAELAAVDGRGRLLQLVRLELPPALRALGTAPARLARALEDPAAQEALAPALAGFGGPRRLVLFPPVLGLDRAEQVAAWACATIGGRVAELVGSPALALAGFRLDRALQAALARAGVALRAARARAVASRDGRAEALLVAAGDEEERLAFDALVLAAGRFVGGGVAECDGQLREPLLGLPLYDLGGRRVDGIAPRRLVRRDYEGEQPLFAAGVRTDARLRPLAADGAPLANVFAAGDLLGGFDPARDRTGLGVALLTGRRAGREASRTRAEPGRAAQC
jgi:glycerol-3-phosphate dehydrogenase/anaerobic glycerol-3-phosphate dehydrogenase